MTWMKELENEMKKMYILPLDRKEWRRRIFVDTGDNFIVHAANSIIWD